MTDAFEMMNRGMMGSGALGAVGAGGDGNGPNLALFETLNIRSTTGLLGASQNTTGLLDQEKGKAMGLGGIFSPQGGVDKFHELFKKMHTDIANAAKNIQIGGAPVGAVGNDFQGSGLESHTEFATKAPPAKDMGMAV